MASTQIQFRLRFVRDGEVAIGPGKVALLAAIADTGSISAAARQMGMSYRRAWLLVDAMNQMLRSPAVTTASGGARGGGSVLTPVGQQILVHYRAIELAARSVAAADVEALHKLLLP